MKEINKKKVMVDFREYLSVEGYIHFEDDDIMHEEHFHDDIESFEYFESPFEPIEIGEYVLYLYASEQNFCSPAINSFDKYFYKEWEVSIEKLHDSYGFVVCTAEIMNEMGYDEFQPLDHYIAYADVDMIQKVFEHLVNKLKLPEF